MSSFGSIYQNSKIYSTILLIIFKVTKHSGQKYWAVEDLNLVGTILQSESFVKLLKDQN